MRTASQYELPYCVSNSFIELSDDRCFQNLNSCFGGSFKDLSAVRGLTNNAAFIAPIEVPATISKIFSLS
ncbi:MAG: hypothetical protein WBN72_08435 [Nitrososphaeraceae archaeon]